MTHPLITDELLEKALSYERPGDQQLRKYASTVRAMLELVAPDIRNQVIEDVAEGVTQWFDSDVVAFIRSLKSKPS
jgi:hypothetical protein